MKPPHTLILILIGMIPSGGGEYCLDNDIDIKLLMISRFLGEEEKADCFSRMRKSSTGPEEALDILLGS